MIKDDVVFSSVFFLHLATPCCHMTDVTAREEICSVGNDLNVVTVGNANCYFTQLT